MSEDKAFDIRKLIDVLFSLPAKAFLEPDTHNVNPYKLVEEAAKGNPLRLRKCLECLREAMWETGEDVGKHYDSMVDGIPCRGDKVVRLIEDALWLEGGSIQLRSLQCGMGKSTAISYVIRDVIEYGDGEGILIATDSMSA